MAHSPADWDIPDPTTIKVPLAGDTGIALRDPDLQAE